MNNPSLMRRGERFRNLHADLQDRLELERFFMREVLTQGFAVDQLGRDIVFAVYLTDLINSQNVRVIESRRGFGFLDKAAQLVGVLAEFFVQKLDSHSAVKFCVLSQIHLAHPARADLRDDAVMRQSGIGWQFSIHLPITLESRFSSLVPETSVRHGVDQALDPSWLVPGQYCLLCKLLPAVQSRVAFGRARLE